MKDNIQAVDIELFDFCLSFRLAVMMISQSLN